LRLVNIRREAPVVAPTSSVGVVLVVINPIVLTTSKPLLSRAEQEFSRQILKCPFFRPGTLNPVWTHAGEAPLNRAKLPEKMGYPLPIRLL
jgi:hypothetical protein